MYLFFFLSHHEINKCQLHPIHTIILIQVRWSDKIHYTAASRSWILFNNNLLLLSKIKNIMIFWIHNQVLVNLLLKLLLFIAIIIIIIKLILLPLSLAITTIIVVITIITIESLDMWTSSHGYAPEGSSTGRETKELRTIIFVATLEPPWS